MKKSIFSLLVLVIILSSCSNNQNKQDLNFETTSDPIPFTYDQIEINGDLGSFESKIESEKLGEGLEIVTLTLSSENPAVPPKFNIKWSIPSMDVYQFWNSKIQTDRVTVWGNHIGSRASSQVPLLCYLNSKDDNRFTFALSDALNKINTNSWLREEDSKYYCQVELFSEPHHKITEYKLQIRIDRRNVPFYQSISECTDWWAHMDNYKPAPVPDDARMPMYSTWYSFHQNLDVAEVIKECRLGKEIGLEAVIVDDGWQTMDNKRGYAYTGDWQPDRIGDMKAFVDSIHGVGMKFLLWYSLPFIGEKANLYPDFKGKYLHHWESQGTWVLDPRYPEVREHIINTYEIALTEWDLDGFKLDFLGWFYADEKTDMTATNGRDFASVNEATDKLMTDIMARLRKIEPEIMIEFRQPYIGPLMRKYGNMFRAADCPNMEVVNRVRTTDLRIASGNTAVHSDMFVWHKSDPVESAALQILNIMFSVPQLSVKLDSIPEDHFEMVKYWMAYWKENQAVLLDGHFIPKNPSALYPVLRSWLGAKEIIGQYSEEVITLNNPVITEIEIINAKGTTQLVCDFDGGFGNAQIKVLDCKGNIVDEYSDKLDSGLVNFNVPPSGMIRMVKK